MEVTYHAAVVVQGINASNLDSYDVFDSAIFISLFKEMFTLSTIKCI